MVKRDAIGKRKERDLIQDYNGEVLYPEGYTFIPYQGAPDGYFRRRFSINNFFNAVFLRKSHNLIDQQ